MLNAAIYIVFAILLIVCALLLLVVLMQRPKQEGLGAAFGAQMTDQAFGAQTTDVLKKGTVLFGTLFMVLCFALTLLMNHRFQQQKSQLGTQAVPAATTEAQKVEEPKQEEAQKEQTPAPAAEQTPATPAQDNLENLVTPAPAAEQPAPAAEQP
ncbi:MAG: preprotein translocase subunit SecG, partial [Akkermansia sp.]|nr:preprotein translocase subunit SecG [Akkermansia sp.]